MYVSAQHLALANQAVLETFENCSVAWQAIPHWDTGDPAQTQVPANNVKTAVPGVLPIVAESVPFDVTLALLEATPDALLSVIVNKTVDLATKVDAAVIPNLRVAATVQQQLVKTDEHTIQDSMISARATVETQGYRAPSCLIVDTAGLKVLSLLVNGNSMLETFLTAGHVNSLHRADTINKPTPDTPATEGLLIGRGRLIPHGGAADASAGEEPADIAVSVPPSVEVVGEKGANTIAMVLRIRYALRVKDSDGIVAFTP